MSCLEAFYWKETAKSKIEFIMSNQTWEVMDLPHGNKPWCYKWIFKTKMKVHGTTNKYKTKLVKVFR